MQYDAKGGFASNLRVLFSILDNLKFLLIKKKVYCFSVCIAIRPPRLLMIHAQISLRFLLLFLVLFSVPTNLRSTNSTNTSKSVSICFTLALISLCTGLLLFHKTTSQTLNFSNLFLSLFRLSTFSYLVSILSSIHKRKLLTTGSLPYSH